MKYTILSTAKAYFGNSWHVVSTVHCNRHRQDINYLVDGAFVAYNSFWANKPFFDIVK